MTRYGLILPIQSRADDLDELLEQLSEEVLAAERAGFDAVFFARLRALRAVGVYPWPEKDDLTLERMAPGRFLYGTEEEVRATAADRVRRTGADYIAVRMRHPTGPSHEETLRAIDRFRALSGVDQVAGGLEDVPDPGGVGRGLTERLV
jgi:alkanesulfonate monooxygenase SsuD/methylene tetrahydromethanopterin reductase-like flavin-dependent oxidoreductase (luciferase family)